MSNNFLSDLTERLSTSASTAMGFVNPIGWQVINRYCTDLEIWRKKGSSVLTPTRRHAEEAIVKFQATLRFDTFRHAQIICYSVTEPIGTDSFRLIEDEQIFPPVLTELDRFQVTPRLYRRCVRGLLRGYFIYDGAASDKLAAQKNWRALQDYLRERLPGMQTGEHLPQWLEVINEHGNLLTNAPCEDYGEDAISGRHERFNSVCAALDVNQDSWLIRQYVLSQIAATCDLDDRSYLSRLATTLDLLDRHPLIINVGLVKLLDRAADVSEDFEHEVITDYSVLKWGNPWLTSNASQWGRVQGRTKDLVISWLKKHYIKLFFSLLSEDRATDDRRLKFWESKYDEIKDVYFALGPAAMYNARPQFKELRKKAKERLLGLTKSGRAENNAFIMDFGDHFVVEFGLIGNACFVFQADDRPFPLVGSVAGNSEELKHESNVAKLIHRDTRDETWEQIFEDKLRHLISGPSVKKWKASSPTEEHHQISVSSGTPKPYEAEVFSTNTPSFFSDDHIFSFAYKHSFRVRDMRSKGGALWIDAPNNGSGAVQRLKTWGFRWAPNRNSWYRQG